jgi:hypothetical protein
VWYQYESLKTDAPGRAYRFEAYEDVDCTSKPVGTIGPEENGVCKDFGTKALGIKVVPLWNANV